MSEFHVGQLVRVKDENQYSKYWRPQLKTGTLLRITSDDYDIRVSPILEDGFRNPVNKQHMKDVAVSRDSIESV